MATESSVSRGALEAAALQAMIDHDNNSQVENEAPPAQQVLLSPERETALRTGDYGKLRELEENQKKDFEAIRLTLKDHEDQALNVITDEHGRELHVCSTENAMFWIHVKEDAAAKEAGLAANDHKDTVYAPTIEVGTFSKNGGHAFLSWHTFKENLDDITIFALAGAVGAVVGFQIFEILATESEQAAAMASAGLARQAAYAEVEAARAHPDPQVLTKAIKDLRAARSNVDRLWMAQLPKKPIFEKFLSLARRFPTVSSLIGTTIVTAAVTVVLGIIWHVINKDLYIKVNITNFDKKAWKVDAWYHNNGIIAGGSGWVVKSMAPAKKEVITPMGAMVAKYTAATNITYFFQNSFTVMDGVGIALRVVQEDDNSKGFGAAYLAKFIKKNRHTVKAGVPPSIEDFYEEEANWPKGTPTVVECEVERDGQRVKIVGSTDALEGRNDNIYTYDVKIG